ncbi:MAG TPA: phosphate ABC transporter substrate-binding protein PstS [Alphaproteobacteria bacterium]
MTASLVAAAAAISTVFAVNAATAADISGAGASFPYPIYSKWADAYQKETGNRLNYQSIGSGGGIKQIQAKTVTFGASDMPLSQEDLAKDGLVQFPTVMGGIVPVANLDGVKPGEMVLDGKTLADIYLGKIKKWDDAAIAKLNPSVKLPSQAIAVVYRSDASGTTFVFSDYLARVSPEFKSKVGVNTSVEWPGGIGGKGNEGVAGTVSQTKGAIGYVETAYAKQNKLTFAKMINKAGKTVNPEIPAFQSAAANADWAGTPGFAVLLNDEPGDNSWPITSATFILMHKQAQDAAASAEALKFFNWAYGPTGDKLAEELDYVPLPDNVIDLIKKTWTNEIKSNGQPVYKM